ncbi:MAG: thiamine phosphate synthase [Kiritimatiellae bacterium]|nr:thiamine phosphate synthase [Kiritimatiellia bacterium]
MKPPQPALGSSGPERFGLYLVLTDPLIGYERCAEAAVKAGVRYLQLRMKNAPRRDVAAMARVLRAITAGSSTRLIVNDDADLAAEVGADGVHLGQDDEALEEARRRHPGLSVLGLSTHNEAQAAAARVIGPSYIGVGPVFATPSKARPDPVLGLARMGHIVAASSLTTVAIGGIDESNLPDVLAAGAVNVAVIRAVCAQPDPYSAIRRLQRLLDAAQIGRKAGA